MAKTAVITGASSGIGAASAWLLARRGFRLCLMARREDRLNGLAGQIRREAGETAAVSVPGDVTDAEDRKKVLARTLDAWGRIDVLVNNAGYALAGAIEDVRAEAVRHQFEVNAFAYAAWMQEVAPVMASQAERGRIINIGSVSGLVAFPGLGAYAASKYAVEAFTDAARRELRPFGVHVVLVEPGSVRSGIWDNVDAMSEALRRDWRTSRYRRLYEVELAHAERMRDGHGPPAEVVAEAVARAATARRPKARYYVTREAKIIALLAKLPAGLQDWVLRRLLA